jgi:hypothetical protein
MCVLWKRTGYVRSQSTLFLAVYIQFDPQYIMSVSIVEERSLENGMKKTTAKARHLRTRRRKHGINQKRAYLGVNTSNKEAGIYIDLKINDVPLCIFSYAIASGLSLANTLISFNFFQVFLRIVKLLIKRLHHL